jgi:hypothetical protein
MGNIEHNSGYARWRQVSGRMSMENANIYYLV